MITIRNLSTENIQAAVQLAVDDWQRKYVLPNAEMIAQAYVEPQALFPLALYAEDTLVGLAFIRRAQKASAMTLEQIMIGQPFQSKGFGSESIREIAKWIGTQFDCSLLHASVQIGNQWAREALETAGFMKRGTDLDTREIEMIYIMK
ncbi:GNAT family N-acetyltransferase [Trichococcus pasteurii]|uniref:Acyl-coa n-acyltransferase n=1 Tax=Trichococcus pasteurii TaxID=43064 RepID=A0A1W1IFA3_9LACT|nr:GNAT family N-acetyltransferase [Trichococcus pasteurii]SFE46380.1 Acetyltransferase (GNAT) domain-containing protein [Trichococcus pasteurii]SLM51700.1 acyl-coa n-acyltransferase [Trichococcus pasteurii]SSB92581.1 acyl-coa n-acyltransferase [Trichococcus pasteurii]